MWVQMRRSTVTGEAGSSIQDSIRTSYGTFLLRRHDSAIARMEDRLAAWTQLPMTHQEDLQVCHALTFCNIISGPFSPSLDCYPPVNLSTDCVCIWG